MSKYLIHIPQVEKFSDVYDIEVGELPIISVESKDKYLSEVNLIPLEEVYFKCKWFGNQAIYRIKNINDAAATHQLNVVKYWKEYRYIAGYSWGYFIEKPWDSCYYRGKEYNLNGKT